MSDYKFDQFYDGRCKMIIDLADAISQDGTLLPIYDRNLLFCPECKSAKLRFTHKKDNCFLSTWPKSNHKKECSYFVKQAPKEVVAMYYNQLSAAQISAKLDSYLNYILRVNSSKIIEPTQNEQNMNPLLLVAHSRKDTIYRLPTRSLKSVKNTFNDMQGIPILFHGTVRLQIQYSLNEKYHSIVLKNIKSNSPFLYLPNGKAKHYDIKENEIYQFVFIGIYEKSMFPRLYKLDSFQYRKITINNISI